MTTVLNRRLAACERGSVAIMFGLTAFVFVICGGIAIDVARALRVSTQLGAAADAAALAAAKKLDDQNATDGDIRDAAESYFAANIQRVGVHGLSLGTLQTTPDRTNSTVNLVVEGTLETAFGKLAGVDTIVIPINTTATYKMKKVELAMMLDVTGSMGSNDKIGALKRAAQDVVDIVIGPGPAGTSPNKVALAPYSGGVNAGPYAAAVSNGESVDGCVFERNGSHAYTDEPADNAGRRLRAMPDPSNPTNDDYTCPSAVVLPLSNDPVQLRDTINSYHPNGWTAGHLGTAWAWYLISPRWASFWPVSSQPVAYNDDKTLKAVILMTDGQFNTFPSINMDRDTLTPQQIADRKAQQTLEANDHAARLCQNMKAEKVLVFAVGFDTVPADEVTLRGCASKIEYFYSARNEAELRQAFSQIAGKLSELRLAQ